MSLNKKCCNCGNDATCEHHIIPIVLGGRDILSNKCYLCDDCHRIIHNVATGTQALSHSELIKAGIQRKREAIEKGEVYTPRSRRKSSNIIGRPKLKVSDLPENFVELYTLKQYKNTEEELNNFFVEISSCMFFLIERRCRITC